MKRFEALRVIFDFIGSRDPIIITANGRVCREVFKFHDSDKIFYMLASMGDAPAIAMGIAKVRPNQTIVLLDGDGNLLMNLGVLPIISAQVKNLVHIVLNNQIFATTGGQKTHSDEISLSNMAQSCGYRSSRSAQNEKELVAALEASFQQEGPSFINVRIDIGEIDVPMISLSPEDIAKRFIDAIKESPN